MHRYAQYEKWADGRWHYVGSVFDGFRPIADAPRKDDLSLVVTLGTLRYRFDSLVLAVRDALQPGWRVFWQLGPNDYGPLPGVSHATVSAAELAQACREADVVVAHAGVGSALMALEAGKHPLLIPRHPGRMEHVDGHQQFIADELAARGLASTTAAGLITADVLKAAATRRVEIAQTPPPIVLDD